jgi:Flp pilus assembly protein TadG
MLFGLLLPAFLGFATLSVDTAVIATARDQLSTAADAAALAGAQQLANDYRLRGSIDMTPDIAAANTQAASFAQANNVLGQGVTLVQNPSNAAGGDILVGYIDPTLPPKTSPFVTASASASLFNSVQVTAQRTAYRGTAVPTFFGGLMGYNGANVSVSATATAASYAIKGFKSVNNLGAALLPIVLDVNTYNQMIDPLNTQFTDQYTYDPATKTVTTGPDGVHESLLYPVSAGLPGNWGTIKVGVSDNSTSTLAAQIQYGITPSQLATFPGGVIQLDPTLTPPSITFSGNPGISAGLASALESIIGDPVSIPIYDQSGGVGDNAWYRVIAFAACRIMSVNFQGNPKYVIIQPALVNDPTAIPDPNQPMQSLSQGGVLVLHLTH